MISQQCRPEDRRYKCLGCGFESINELDAENHQIKCDNAMERIKE